ncbi:hypothetical protein [Maribacter luteus]|uniref:Lipocalin-like domain-containing protein n=1 Tax=Maribacter luteus TaxID=2594478 RepID=A0A6I2MS92_9FLAO|nr:hypothetical protein [Maribacter luteus]MRX65767.1 hypothetical protein [Maribacter luteus]
MKTYKSLFYLIALVFTFSFISCSDDDSDDQEATESIIGEWLFVSENDYYCGTDDVRTERLASDNDYEYTLVFGSDMTYKFYIDGVLVDYEDQMGTWENLGDGFYQTNYTVNGEPESEIFEVEFEGDLMNLGVDDPCVDAGGDNIYTYEVWTRQ